MDGVANPAEAPALAEHVRELEDALRSRWAGSTRADLNKLAEFEAYRDYYRRFDKTYHVQFQFESVVLKGRQLRSKGALVLAMFAAELQNRLLTAGHDLATIEGGLIVDVAVGGEQYVGLGGREQSLQPNDMFIRDAAGILSSVLYGPDDRTQIKPTTRQALFCVYAPPGIESAALEAHLSTIAGNVRRLAPDSVVVSQQIYTAS